MSGTKGKSGGRREGSGRPPVPNPKGPKQYIRKPIARPETPTEQQSLKWFDSLSPKDRLSIITEAFENSPNWGEWLRTIGTVDENGIFTPKAP